MHVTGNRCHQLTILLYQEQYMHVTCSTCTLHVVHAHYIILDIMLHSTTYYHEQSSTVHACYM